MKHPFLVIVILLISLSAFSQSTSQEIVNNRFLVRKENKYGVIDSSKKIIIPFKYDFIEFENERLIVRSNGLHGLLSLDNEELIPIEYKFILPRNKQRFILWTNKSLFGLSDVNGEILIPIKYRQVSSLENHTFYVTENQSNINGVYDYSGKNIIPELYKFYTIDGEKIFATKNNKPQILNLLNAKDTVDLGDIKLIETVKHYSISEEMFQIIKKNEKYGLINSKNETIIPLQYDDIKSSENWRFFIVKSNNKIGIVNINGTIAKKPIYDSIELRKEYVLLKRKNAIDELYVYDL